MKTLCTLAHSRTSYRWVVQLIMLTIIILGASLRNLGITGWAASLIPELQAFCPIGAVYTLSRILARPSFLAQAVQSHLWVLAGVMLITVLFGAIFCSTLCPLGALQEWTGKLGRKLLKKQYNPAVNKKTDIALGSLRYVILLMILLTALGHISIALDMFNPSIALKHMWTTAVPVTSLVLFLGMLLLSLVYERPWCRWACPYGLVLGFLGRFSIWKIRRDDPSCIHCKACDRACPTRIPVSSATIVKDLTCSRCMRCISACPVAETMTCTPAGGTRSLNSASAAALLSLVLFFTPITAARAINWHITAESTVILDQYTAVQTSREISPLMTLDDLAESMGMAYHELGSILGLPEGYDFSTLIIDIEEEESYEHITLGYIREQMHRHLQDQ